MNFSVPSSPSNILLSPASGSPTALFANWSVPIARNGIITAYTVYCNTSASQAYPEQVIGPNLPTIRSVANGTTLAVTFNTRLNPYTQYSCYVTANTSAGVGSPSMVVTARTVENGETLHVCIPLISECKRLHCNSFGSLTALPINVCYLIQFHLVFLTSHCLLFLALHLYCLLTGLHPYQRMVSSLDTLCTVTLLKVKHILSK